MQKMQEHFSALHCPNTRRPWRNAKSAFTPSMAFDCCRQAPHGWVYPAPKFQTI